MKKRLKLLLVCTLCFVFSVLFSMEQVVEEEKSQAEKYCPSLAAFTKEKLECSCTDIAEVGTHLCCFFTLGSLFVTTFLDALILSIDQTNDASTLSNLPIQNPNEVKNATDFDLLSSFDKIFPMMRKLKWN